MEIIVTPYVDSDRPFVIEGNIDLQDTERDVSEFCLPGIQIGEIYLDHLLKLNAQNFGTILVARVEGRAVGFIGCRIENDESITTTDEANRYGYISDAWTDHPYRNRGVFKKLSKAVEDYFMQFPEIKIIKLNVLIGNESAVATYRNNGYKTQELVLAKRIRS
jgi:ribosomal protein S18 acetylase RimI-like enzyme